MDFSSAMDYILKFEGGLSDDPDDPGGITKYGISLRAYPLLLEDGIRNLTKHDAAVIYKRDYWDHLMCDSLPSYLRLMAFDCAIVQGPTYATKALQAAVASPMDGVMGPNTLNAANEATPRTVIQRYSLNRFLRYKRNVNWDKYGDGWISRLLSVTIASN